MFGNIAIAGSLVWGNQRHHPLHNDCNLICKIASIVGGFAIDAIIVGVVGSVGILAFVHIIAIPIWSGGVLVGFAGCYAATAVLPPLAFLGFMLGQSIARKMGTKSKLWP